MKNDFFKNGEYEEFIIDRAKAQRDIDDQIDQIDGEFQKNKSPEESYELERERGVSRYWGVCGDGGIAGGGNSDRPIPRLGEVAKENGGATHLNATKRGRDLWKLNYI